MNRISSKSLILVLLLIFISVAACNLSDRLFESSKSGDSGDS